MSDTSESRKPWAVLAYTVADDKGGGSALDAAAQRELKALCDASQFDLVSVAAQVDFKRPRGVFRASLTASPPKERAFEDVRAEDHPLWRRILGKVDERRSVLRVQAERKDLSAARGNVLREFVDFGRRECPAERYVVYFYGHAYGPLGLFCDAETGQREKDTLRLSDLATSLAGEGRPATVVVFRDCFMNTLETAFQLRGVAEQMIATQALAPVSGIWPWTGFMSALMPSAASADVGRAIAIQLARFLDEPQNREPFASVPYSLLDLGAAEALVEPLKALTAALEAAREDEKRCRACAQALEAARIGAPAQRNDPGDPALVDVPTMCEKLAALPGDPVSGPAAALGDVVRTKLVRFHHTQTSRHRGTSLYYKPATVRDLKRSYLQAEDEEVAAADAAHYATLGLSEATGWHRVASNPLPV